jgi:hypothetical protein
LSHRNGQAKAAIAISVPEFEQPVLIGDSIVYLPPKCKFVALQPLADDGCALTVLAVGRPGFWMGVADTAHIPKFRNKHRPEGAPWPLN